MKTKLTLEQKIKLIHNLPEVRLDAISQAQVAAQRVAQAKQRFAQEMADMEEQFNLECWRMVEKSWTPQEIEEALK